MTSTLLLVVKIIAAIAGIYGVCKLETYLESKINEPYGTRTDILIITSIIAVTILAIFIMYQAWSICGPIIISIL